MLVGAKTVTRVLRATVLAAVFPLGVLPAAADDFSAQSVSFAPGVWLLPGVQACEPTLQDGMGKGSECMAGWAAGIVELTDCRLFSAFFHEARPLKLRKAVIDYLPRFRS